MNLSNWRKWENIIYKLSLYLRQFQANPLKTIIYKAFILILLLMLGAFTAQGFLWLFAWFYKIDLKASEDIIDLLKNEEISGKVKIFIGLNHIVTFLVFPYFFLMKFYKSSISSYLSIKKFHPVFIPLFLVLLISLYPLMAYISFWMNQLDWPPFLEGLDITAMESLGELLKMNSLTDLFINIMIIGIIPGITEEFLFRGIIQNELKIYSPNYHLAVWIAAILFGLMHLQIIGLFPKIIIGVVLGYAYHYSGSLILPMLLHAINNSFATMAYYFNPVENSEIINNKDAISIFPVLFFTISAIIIFKYINTQSKILQYANE
jgi:membrane protease YdiL (CAAX protease family)